MLSFHNDIAVKAKYVERVKSHAAADRIIQGTGWDNGRGCAVGCTLENYDHSRYPIELGLPEWLARLEDHLFERLPKDQAMQWPLQFLEAIPVGVDVEIVRHQLAIRRLDRLIALQISNKGKHDFKIDGVIDQTIAAIEGVKALHSAEVDGKNCPIDAESAAWSAARSAARSAESAAWSAGESAARSAESAARSAESAAWSAGESAWSAAESAWSAARSAESAAWSAGESAWSAAESAETRQEADDLLELLAACKPESLGGKP